MRNAGADGTEGLSREYCPGAGTGVQSKRIARGARGVQGEGIHPSRACGDQVDCAPFARADHRSPMGYGLEDAPEEWEADALTCARALRDAADPEWGALAAQVWDTTHCQKFNAPYTCGASEGALDAIAERLAVRKVRPIGWAGEAALWRGLMNLAYFGQQEGDRGRAGLDGAYRARLCVADLDKHAIAAASDALDAGAPAARDAGVNKVLHAAVTFLFEVSLTPTLQIGLIECGLFELGERVLAGRMRVRGGDVGEAYSAHEAILALACLNAAAAMKAEELPEFWGNVDIESILEEITRAHVEEVACMGYRWSDEEVCASLVSAATDEPRSATLGRKVVPLLLEAISSCDDFSRVSSQEASSDDAMGWYCMSLWQLAFSKENAELIWANKSLLKKIRNEAGQQDGAGKRDEDVEDGADHFVKIQAEGLLRTLDIVLGVSEKRPQNAGSRENSVEQNTHIMISYCWAEGQKEIATAIARRLRSEGIPYWIDQEKMEGNTISAMSRAVEEAKSVVLLVSSNYMASHNCRLEAMYANECRKMIQPVIVQDGYKADGWLGLLLAGQYYVKMSQPDKLKESMDILVGKLRPLFKESELGTPSPPEVEYGKGSDLEIGRSGAPPTLTRTSSMSLDKARARIMGNKWRAKAKTRSAHTLASLFAGVRENLHAQEDNSMLDAFFGTSRLLDINNSGRKDDWDEDIVSDEDDEDEKSNAVEGRSTLVSCVRSIYGCAATCLKFVLHGGAEEDREMGGEVDRAEAGLKVKPKRRYESCRGLLLFNLVFAMVSLATWYNALSGTAGSICMFLVSLWPMAMQGYLRLLDPGLYRAALLGNLKDAHVRIISYLSLVVSLNAGLLPFLDGNIANDPFFCYSTMDMSAELTYEQDLTERSDDVYFGTCRWTTYVCAEGGTCPAGFWDEYTTPSCAMHELALERMSVWNETRSSDASKSPDEWDWCPTYPRRWYYLWKFSTVMVLMWLIALTSVSISVYFQPSPWTLKKLRKRLGGAELRGGTFCHSVEFSTQILLRRILRTEFMFSWWIGFVVGASVALYTMFGSQDPSQFRDTPWPFWLCFAAYIFSVVFSCLLYHTYCFRRSDILLRGVVVRFELLTAAISGIFDQQNLGDTDMAELDDVGLGQLVSEEIAEVVENHVKFEGYPTQRLQQWLAYRSVVVSELIPVIEYCSSFGLASVTLPALFATGITLYNVTIYGIAIIITGQLAMLEFICAVMCSMYTLKLLSTACSIYTVQDAFAGMIQDEMLQEAIYVGNNNNAHAASRQARYMADPSAEASERTPLTEQREQLREVYYEYLRENKFFIRLFGIPVKPMLFIILRLYFATAAFYIIGIGIIGYTA